MTTMEKCYKCGAMMTGYFRQLCDNCRAMAVEDEIPDAPPEPKMPLCPWCKTNKKVYHEGDRNYFCRTCKRSFDDDPDEGGDWSQDPTRRIQREEQRAQRQREWIEREGRRR